MAVLPTSESSTLHFLLVTEKGFRLFFTTTPDGVVSRPSLLALVHIRCPPCYSLTNASGRQGVTVHQAFYRKGIFVLHICAQHLWLLSVFVIDWMPMY